MSNAQKQIYEFGRFQLNAADRVLLCAGEVVKLMPKTLEALALLVQKQGAVVSKEELQRTLWPNAIVEENNLAQHISALRKALGQADGEEPYIETVPKRGYRFVAAVRQNAVPDLGAEPGEAAALAITEVAESHPNAVEPLAHKAITPHTVPEPAQALKHWWRTRHFRFAAGALVLLVVVPFFLPFFLLERVNPTGSKLQTPRSLAILPFHSLSSNEADESLGLGVADLLINRLSRSNQLLIRPLRSVVSYAKSTPDLLQAGQELQVETVLDGNWQVAGKQLRVTARLLRVQDGVTLWAGQFDGPFNNQFAAQDWIANAIAEPLSWKIGLRDTSPASRQLTNEAARAAYLRARYLWNRRTDESMISAIAYYREVVALDPEYAPAWAGLAEAYVLQYGLSLTEKVALVRQTAERALALDSTQAQAHTALAFMYENCEYEWQKAEAAYRRAVAANPNYATAHHWFAECLAFLGRFDEALVEIRRAQAIDPLSLAINKDFGVILAYAGQYPQAIEQYQKTLELDPNFVPVYGLLAACYEVSGRYDEAAESYLKEHTLNGIEAAQIAALRTAYKNGGWKGFWQQQLQLLKADQRRKPTPYLLAQVHLRLGNRESALQYLQQAYELGHLLSALKVDALLKPLHAEPRFQELLRRTNLAG